ncbi:B12-binding domain-containing radical SAM protein [Betaproteobacteria bacterium]|nr:B12-binding domain-containing radical SAM protein [Betaproteobacteria bacterium]GHU44971.1 B12-binding domain-containing radical SAM protein [Betaproteobacteria bacterium]
MKILFLVPMHIPFGAFTNPDDNQRVSQKQDGRFYNLPPTDLPLGVLSMSAFLKKWEKVEVQLIDFNIEAVACQSFDYDSFFAFAQNRLSQLDFKPDLIGVSCLFSPAFQNFMETGLAARQVFENTVIIGGGNIPTSAWQEIYLPTPEKSPFDALCYGEGELPMLELVRSGNPFEYFKTAKSWITPEKACNGFVPQHTFIENLDEIPFFDYDLCDIDQHNANLVVTSFATSKKERSFHVMTSRGCPFKCTFCASHAVHGRDMRYHSLERIRADFMMLKEKYGATMLIFQDDHFMSDRNRVFTILNTLKELDLHSTYQSGLALYALDRPMLEAFHAAGVRQLVLAVESGSQRVLKHLMKKPLKLEISQRVANDCRELGIYTNTNILIGIPGETKEDIEDTRKNLRTINSNWFHINCTSPLVGSEIHAVAKKHGYIQGNTLGADYKVAAIETPDFSVAHIREMQYLLNLELNFVYNNDMRLGEYQTALKGFENVITIRKDHAFAWFYAGECHKQLGDTEQAAACRRRYDQYATTSFWKQYVSKFALPFPE